MTSNSQFPSSSPPTSPELVDASQQVQQLQQQLAQMAAQQQQVLDTLPVTVWQADDQGQIISLSAHWQTITGRSPLDSLGEAFWESVAEERRDRSRQQWQIACQQQQPFEIHLDLCQTHGTAYPVLAEGKPLRDTQHQRIGWVGTLQPTDPLTPMQIKLDYSQKFLQAVLDNLSNGIVACDAQGVLTLFNCAMQKLHGRPFCPIPAEQWADHYDLYQADGTTPLVHSENPLYQALQGESIQNAEVVIKPSQGPPRTILASGDPIIAKDGQKLGAVVALQDITQRKQAELELRKSEERWQLALQGTGDGLFDWNIVTNEAFLSPKLKQTLGYADHEVDNSFEGWRQLVHPDDLEEVAAAIEAHLQQNVPLYAAEYRMRCKDGSFKWILARGQTQWDDNGQPIRMIGSHQDITRQKQAEQKLAQLNRELEERVNARTSQLAAANHQNEALQTQEQKARRQAEVAKAETELYEQMIRNIQLGFLVWHSPDLELGETLQLVATNPAAEHILETELHSKIGNQMGVIFPNFTQQYPHILLSLLQVIQKQHPRSIENVPFTLPNGEENIFSLRAFPLPEDCVGVAFENVTFQKRTEAALSLIEQRYRTIVDSVKEVIFQTDTHGCWTFLNSAWTEITGYAIRESLGKSLTELVVSQADQQKWQDLFASFIREEQTVLNHKVEILTKAKERRWLEIRVVPFPDADGFTIGTFGTINDITELQQTEANLQAQANQLIQLNAELMDTTTQLEKRNQELDQFAYVTSHDLKAPLRAIANLSEWIEEDLEGQLTGDTRDQMTLLRNRVLRMENLINGLLSYSRAGRLQEPYQIVDVKQLVAEVVDSLDVPKTFEVRLDTALSHLKARILPLQQVFASLIDNAIKHHDQDQGVIEITAEDKGNHYQFKVTDDGPGIASQYHDKVFSIFQTLKARDSFESTGIGLSIVKKIVEAQGGAIAVVSQLGAGATFCFTWPKPELDS